MPRPRQPTPVSSPVSPLATRLLVPEMKESGPLFALFLDPPYPLRTSSIKSLLTTSCGNYNEPNTPGLLLLCPCERASLVAHLRRLAFALFQDRTVSRPTLTLSKGILDSYHPIVFSLGRFSSPTHPPFYGPNLSALSGQDLPVAAVFPAISLSVLVSPAVELTERGTDQSLLVPPPRPFAPSYLRRPPSFQPSFSFLH